MKGYNERANNELEFNGLQTPKQPKKNGFRHYLDPSTMGPRQYV
jgi:hypothetical protein